MAQTVARSHDSMPTAVPDGIEPVPRSSYPEAIPTLPGHEKWSCPSPTAQHSSPTTYGSSPPEKRICGMRRLTFILVALLALAIVAAAVGGGIGGSIAVDKAYDRGLADSSTEPRDENEGASGARIRAPPTSGLLELDCPDIDKTVLDIDVGGTRAAFRAKCGINHPEGDLVLLPAYSFNDCLVACATYNRFNATAKRCIATKFNARLANERGGNCWLKHKIGEDVEVGNGMENNHVSGELLD